MVITLSHEDVIKICSTCPKFVRESESCRSELEVKSLKEVHRCKKWDEQMGGPSIYQG